jgi:HlyD family type I secretion membrane fusion protein
MAAYTTILDGTVRPHDSARSATLAGWLVIAAFFAGFGFWAATAPMNAAIVGDAIVKVEGNRKSVQHLDGGTVQEILVKEGDQVTAGAALIRLDDTLPRAQVEILTQQQAQLLATEVRLRAELDGATELVFPSTLTDRQGPAVLAAMSDQQREFASRADAVRSRVAVLEARGDQYDAQIVGLEAQRAPLVEQLDSIRSELSSLDVLLAKGLTTRTRMLELQRQESAIKGQLAEIVSKISVADQAIAEIDQQVFQIKADEAAASNAELRDISARLSEVTPRLEAAKVALDRSIVRSPYSGVVVDLAVFSVGAVVGRGERLLDIVPEDKVLNVETRIRVEDISDVKPGMPAEVHFTSYKQRILPLIRGTVAEVSADRLTDERTQIPYYLATVDVNPNDLAASPEIELYPGMPASVMITTRERTALDYMIGPLTASFERAFRER